MLVVHLRYPAFSIAHLHPRKQTTKIRSVLPLPSLHGLGDYLFLQHTSSHSRKTSLL